MEQRASRISSPLALVMLPGLDGTGRLFVAFCAAIRGFCEPIVVSYPHDAFGQVHRAASPLRLSGPRPVPGRAPRRGEHAEAILTDLCGLNATTLTEFAERGAFGQARLPTSAAPHVSGADR